MFVYAIGLFAVVAIAGIAYKMSRPAARQTDFGSSAQVNADLELLEHQPTNINFFKYVTGTIRNNTDRTFAQVQVQISVYANKGELMGTTTASTANLKPDECWEFQAPVLEQGEFSYKFTSITGC